MEKVIIGKKVGMTQVFDESGKLIPVTVVEAGPCKIVQVKSEETAFSWVMDKSRRRRSTVQ